MDEDTTLFERSAPAFVHPDALGIARTPDSPFVERTAAGSTSVIKVLRWDTAQQKGWVQRIETLPRTHRPTVYCPFCGREGTYALTDRYRYFRHGNGEQACVEAHLESIRHRRAKAVLLAGLQTLRVRGQPLRWSRKCQGCNHVEVEELLPGAGWAREREESVHRLGGEKTVVADVGVLAGSGALCLALEVRKASPVAPEKLDAFEAHGVPMVELSAASLMDERGEPAWTGHTALPCALVWRVSGVEAVWRCSGCRDRIEKRRKDAERSREVVVDQFRELVRRARQYGVVTHDACTRCRRPQEVELVPAGAEVQKAADEPLGVRLVHDGGAFGVGLDGMAPSAADGPHVVVHGPALPIELDQTGPWHLELSRIRAIRRPSTPLVCTDCRAPSDAARALDVVWQVVYGGNPALVPRMKDQVERLLGLPTGALADQHSPFGVPLDQRPEDFTGHAALGFIAWEGMNGRVDGLALMEGILERKLRRIWTDLDGMVEAPHAALVEMLASGETVRGDDMLLADKLVELLGLGARPAAVQARQVAWALEAVVDELDARGHTLVTLGRSSLRTRIFKRWKDAHEGSGATFQGDTGEWIDRAIEAGCLRAGHNGFALPVDLKAAGLLADRLGAWEGRPEYRFDGVVSDLDLADKQAEAVRRSARYSLSIITGGAGTGKTTVVRALLTSLPGERHLVVAPTGKAVHRLEHAVGGCAGMQAPCTLAKLLRQTERLNGVHNLVIDEAGFMDLRAAAELFDAVDKARNRGLRRVVLVGDPNQLPSVGRGAVLETLLEEERGRFLIPRTHLHEVHRNAGPIVAFAESVLEGNPRLELVTHVPVQGERPIQDAVRAIVEQEGSLDHTQILAPRHRDVTALNKTLQGLCNPNGVPVSKPGGLRFGDRVIATVNRYDAPRLLNGEPGRLVPPSDPSVAGFCFRPPNGTPRGPFSLECEGLFAPAYALTVHKAQGSEWDRVIVAVPHTGFFDRRMLYTAVTRARKQVVIVGASADIVAASRRMPKRNSVLRAVLRRADHTRRG